MTFNPVPLRREDADVLTQLNNPPAQAQGPAAAPQQPQPATPPDPTSADQWQIQEQLNQFLVANGALVRINDAGRDHGQIRAFDNATRDTSKAPPTVVMRNEDYGRISRLLADKRQVELEFEIVNRSYPEGRTSYNAIAEIPGSDKADEVVMLGGHLDSWHAATGATDNAIGCSVMMEAVRILSAIGARPRRTIRVALWSGEEQGLLGSRAYVRQHFGTFEDQKPEYAKLSAYINMDSGTGRVRGLTAFGPAATANRAARSHGIVQGSRHARRDNDAVAGRCAGPTRPTSTRRVCQASTPFSIRFSTRPTPGTPTSTPTSASSRTM